MVYVGMCDYYENIKIKLCSSISILKAWHVEIFRSKKKMSRKGSVVSFNRAGGLNPSEGNLGGRAPLWKFLGSKEYLDWFNDTGKTLSYSIQYKNLLKYKLDCSWHLSYVYTIN